MSSPSTLPLKEVAVSGMRASGQVRSYCRAASRSTGAKAVEPDRCRVPAAQSSGAAAPSLPDSASADCVALTRISEASSQRTWREAKG